MIPNEIVYDGSTESLRQVCELHPKGVPILCPKCRARLIVALDLEEANKNGVHPGLYCPRDRSHVSEVLSLASTHRSVLGGFLKAAADRDTK